jgi:hypothetical protein
MPGWEVERLLSPVCEPVVQPRARVAAGWRASGACRLVARAFPGSEVGNRGNFRSGQAG